MSFQEQNNLVHTLPHPKPAKTNHVRFAGINGRMSPVLNGDHSYARDNITVSQGFPFISPGSRSRSPDDSLVVESGTPVEARLGNLESDLELSAQIATPAMCSRQSKAGYQPWEENPEIEGGEENQPPDGGKGGDHGKGKGQGKSGQGQRSTPRRAGKLNLITLF